MSLHLSGPEVEAAIAQAKSEAIGTPGAHIAAAVTTGVANPANAAYTQADQTALAADFVALVGKFNTLLTELQAKGILS